MVTHDDTIPFTDVPRGTDDDLALGLGPARAWWRSTLALLRRSRDLAVIGHAGSCLQFSRGDLGLVIKRDFGDDALSLLDERIAARYGVDPETLRGERWVAAKIPLSARRLDEGVSFSAHKAVARLDPATRDRILTQAIAEGRATSRGVRDLRREMTGEAAPAKLDPEMTYADYLAGRLVEHFAWLDTGQAAQIAAFEARVDGEFQRAQSQEAA
jgi:hypothetical protein